MTVADDKNNTTPTGRGSTTNQAHELRDWAKKFGVFEDMLRTAVTQVGNQATDVERYLKDKAKR